MHDFDLVFGQELTKILNFCYNLFRFTIEFIFEKNFQFKDMFSVELENQSLATAQFVLKFLSICPADESAIPSKKRAYIVFTSIVAVSQLCGLGTSLSYLIKFILIDFEGSLFAFLAFIGHAILIYSLLMAFSVRQTVASIFSKLSTIYKESKFLRLFCVVSSQLPILINLN